MPNTDLSHICIFGDSLSDSGNMEHSHLLGFLPVPGTGLEDSGDGRFAGRLSWPGYLTLKRLETAIEHHEALMDRKDKHLLALLAFHKEELTHDGVDVRIGKHLVCRNYAIGGATSATYSAAESAIELAAKPNKWRSCLPNPLTTLAAIGAQAAVSNLENQYKQLAKEQARVAPAEKTKALIVEWSGANDLITVNTEPTNAIADAAVTARIAHLQKLYDLGYRNFVLFNMPDLSKTPRYAKKSKEEREAAQNVVKHFNEQLDTQFKEFIAVHQDTQCLLFDAHAKFDEVYADPKAFGLDPSKKATPQSEETGYDPKSGVQPRSTGHMFWNDVHPSSAVQKILADKLYKQLEEAGFSFKAADDQLLQDMENIAQLDPGHIKVIEDIQVRIDQLRCELSSSSRSINQRIS